jgi:hypothetical protein
MSSRVQVAAQGGVCAACAHISPVWVGQEPGEEAPAAEAFITACLITLRIGIVSIMESTS